MCLCVCVHHPAAQVAAGHAGETKSNLTWNEQQRFLMQLKLCFCSIYYSCCVFLCRQSESRTRPSLIPAGSSVETAAAAAAAETRCMMSNTQIDQHSTAVLTSCLNKQSEVENEDFFHYLQVFRRSRAPERWSLRSRWNVLFCADILWLFLQKQRKGEMFSDPCLTKQQSPEGRLELILSSSFCI